VYHRTTGVDRIILLVSSVSRSVLTYSYLATGLTRCVKNNKLLGLLSSINWQSRGGGTRSVEIRDIGRPSTRYYVLRHL
jgi:hypothetical protein